MYKLTNRFNTKPILAFVFILVNLPVNGQDSSLNKYGLWIVNNAATYNKTIEEIPGKQIVNIRRFVPKVVFDLRYATTNNFTGKKIYPSLATTYLRKDAAIALQHVQQELNQKGLGLKIFDAYRPYSATELMWELVKDDRYTADPKKGSNHNRGIAVDLTIYNLSTQADLEMGTGFDNFTDSAHHAFTALPSATLQNRLLLKNTMEKYGFRAFDTEWWHYALPDISKYELLNISFKDLEKLAKE